MPANRHAVHAAIAFAMLATACDRTETASLDQQSDFRCAVTLADGVALARDSTGLWDAGASSAMAAGGIIVASADYGGNLLAWRPDGTRLKTIGTRGGGPGEFSGAALQVFAGAADTLHVYDGTHWFLLDGTLNIVSSRGNKPQAMQGYAHFLDDGTILTTRPIGAMQDYFAVSSRDGRILRSFGDIDSTLLSRAPSLARLSSHPHGGRFWTAPGTLAGEGYVLERWNVDGSREARLERNVPWMATAGIRPADRPPPQFGIVHEDSTGLLWIVTIAPADNWHIDPATELTPDDIFAMTTYHLDVIDPSTKEVIASEQIGNTANIPSAFLGIGRTALFRSEDSTGVPKASIREYALVDQTGGSCATRKR